jgi:hypothetical protein
MDNHEIERFAIDDTSAIEVRIHREQAAEGQVATVEVALLMGGGTMALVRLAPGHVTREGANAVCGQIDDGKLTDFVRLVIDLPQETPAFDNPGFVMTGYASAPHRAVVDHVDQDTVRVAVDANKDGTLDREWTVDLGWEFGSKSFRHKCEAKLQRN